jgi:tetratricopeptide (TPR) repeat protein
LPQVFVSRNKELDRLAELLGRALQGHGQVAFVTGEAGFGKTSLTLEFARRAQEANKELLVAIGDCNSQTGISDPYLPFRELLRMLTGEFADRVATGTTTEENASRLRDFLRISKHVVAEVAPDLIDLIIPGVGLVTKAGFIVAGNRSPLKHRPGAPTPGGGTQSIADASPMAEQSRIFEQVTAVLVAMAAKRPLILILDDLQWVDESSVSLLFHLARRLEGSRILIIGTYRPEDVAPGRGGDRHPLVQVVSELKIHYGDIHVVLGDETPGEIRHFIDSLIDTEPNRLGEEFRRALQQRTRGHPLFATEMLRNMQDRGDLVQDENGYWVEGPSLDWKQLPARVEGVIEERIQRIRSEVQELLTIASVEGETFTVQVVSRLQQVNERELLKVLSQELDRQHRLVSEAGIERLGTMRISQFRFRHEMFQRYFYEHLGESERELMHEDVASVLEAIYVGQTDKVAVRLAHHFELARLDDRAAACFLEAGRRALSVYAHREAIALAQRGIASLNRLGDVTAHAELLLDLNLLLGDALHHDGRFAESMDTFRQTAELAATLGAPTALAQAALGYDEPRWRCNLLEPIATKLLKQALDLLDPADSDLRVRLLAHLARSTQGSVPAEEVLAQLDEAVAMARRIGDPRALVEALRTRLSLDRSPAHVDARLELIDEMLKLARQIYDKQLTMELLAFRIYDLAAIGDVASWSRDLEEHQRFADEIGEPFYSYNVRAMKTALAVNAGRFEEAERLALEAMQTGQQLGVNNVEGVLGVQMFTIRREQGRLREIAPVLRHFVEERGAGAAWRPGLALIYADLDQLDAAQSEFERLAADDFAGIPRDSLWQTCLCYLTDVCDRLQDEHRAGVLHGLLLPYAEQTVVVGNATVCLGATARFLGQLATIQSRWDVATAHFEQALDLNGRMGARPWIAHTQFQYARMLLRRGRPEDAERAARLVDEANRAAQALGMREFVFRVKEEPTVC